MKTKKAHSALAAIAVIAAVVATLSLMPSTVKAATRKSPTRKSLVSPFIKLGPKAVPSNVGGPGYSLFSCQVGQSTGVCYDPYQMRHAYNVDNLINAGLDGKGKTIVIIDAYQSPNIVAQLNYFNIFYGLKGLNGLGNNFDHSLGTFRQVAPDGLTPFVTGDDNMTGWAEEISLDVLWAHAIAPGANITLVLAKSNDDADILSATKYAVDHNLGDVISQSFGEAESCMDPKLLTQQHQIFAAATLKFMTLFASSGDEGAAQASCDGNSWIKAASTPASDPLVTGVGATELRAADYCLTSLGCDPTKNPAAGTYQSEIAWNEGPPFGDFQDSFDSTLSTGGGFSILFDTPAFQQGAVHGKQRGVPDVAYSGAVLHGVLTYLDIPGIPAGFYRFGGTSAGSPQWAAILAIADQQSGFNLGFINKALYQIAGSKSQYAGCLHDVTKGTNSAAEFDSTDNLVTILGFSAASGWDPTTGLGSPKSDPLAYQLDRYVSPIDGLLAILDAIPHNLGNRPPWWRGRARPH